MTRPLIIKNGRILDPSSQYDGPGSLLIENGVIADLASGQPGDDWPLDADTLDAKGLLVIPGLIDTRTFIGEPGHEYRETLASASKAAAAGGVTTFLCMPDTDPALDEPALIDYVRRRAEATALVNVVPGAALTKGLAGKEITEYGLLKEAGAVALTDGRHAIQNGGLLRTAFSYAASMGLPVIHLSADHSLAGDGVMNEGAFASMLGLKGIPSEAETIPLERDLQIAALTGVRYHAAQISTARAAQIVARHRAENSAISAGVSVNHLLLNENDVGSYRTYFKLSPPLRAEDDRLAMVEALRQGIVGIIHSDHDPQDTEGKRRPFAEAASGAIGLETMLSAALRLYHSGDVELMTLIGAMTSNPAKLLGLQSGRLQQGAPADIALVDLDYPFVVEEKGLHSRSRNTTFEGARLSGKVVRTIVGGRTIYGADNKG